MEGLYSIFGLVSLVCWLSGVVLLTLNYITKKRIIHRISVMLALTGLISLISFTIILWISLGRPPMRTLGETRLWYAVFLPATGLVVHLRWKYKWFLIYSLALASVFLVINLLTPENFGKTLMPALQSIWFVPHVIVYIFSYALLAASSIVSVYGLFRLYFRSFDRSLLHLADNLVYIGFGFLTLGLLFGALWAKEAWGHYWTWDPKETWAFITWMGYLVYMHLRHYRPMATQTPLWILAIAFIILLICWFGINYLPVAANSVHTYGG